MEVSWIDLMESFVCFLYGWVLVIFLLICFFNNIDDDGNGGGKDGRVYTVYIKRYG